MQDLDYQQYKPDNAETASQHSSLKRFLMASVLFEGL